MNPAVKKWIVGIYCVLSIALLWGIVQFDKTFVQFDPQRKLIAIVFAVLLLGSVICAVLFLSVWMGIDLCKRGQCSFTLICDQIYRAIVCNEMENSGESLELADLESAAHSVTVFFIESLVLKLRNFTIFEIFPYSFRQRIYNRLRIHV